MKRSWLAFLLTPCLAFASYSNENELEDKEVGIEAMKVATNEEEVSSKNESLIKEDFYSEEYGQNPVLAYEEEEYVNSFQSSEFEQETFAENDLLQERAPQARAQRAPQSAVSERRENAMQERKAPQTRAQRAPQSAASERRENAMQERRPPQTRAQRAPQSAASKRRENAMQERRPPQTRAQRAPQSAASERRENAMQERRPPQTRAQRAPQSAASERRENAMQERRAPQARAQRAPQSAAAERRENRVERKSSPNKMERASAFSKESEKQEAKQKSNKQRGLDKETALVQKNRSLAVKKGTSRNSSQESRNKIRQNSNRPKVMHRKSEARSHYQDQMEADADLEALESKRENKERIRNYDQSSKLSPESARRKSAYSESRSSKR